MRANGWMRPAALAGLLLAIALPGCREGRGPAQETASSPLAAALRGMKPQAQIDTLRAIARSRPDDPQVAYHVGNAYYARGAELGTAETAAVAYLDSASVAYTRAVELDSTMSKAWVNLGLALQDTNRRPQAQRAFETAIAVNPGDVLAYCHLGYLYQSLGDLDAAMEQYRRALAVDPNSAQAHYNLGLAFADAKIFAEALREWEDVVRLDPDGDLGRTAAENVKILRQYLEAKP